MESTQTLEPRPARDAKSRLRFPKLFVIVTLLFVLDLLLPDVVPFVDEIILGALAVMLGILRKRLRGEPDEAGE